MRNLIETLTGQNLSGNYSENEMLAAAFFTDHADFYKLPLTDEEKAEMQNGTLLECRFFSPEGEIKIRRASMSDDWKIREIPSKQNENLTSWREWQYLDIDATSVGEQDENYLKVRTTGGGEYRIPRTGKVNRIYNDWKDGKQTDLNIKICIEYYIDYYPQTGQAYVKDWRLVTIGREKSKDGEVSKK